MRSPLGTPEGPVSETRATPLGAKLTESVARARTRVHHDRRQSAIASDSDDVNVVGQMLYHKRDLAAGTKQMNTYLNSLAVA